MKKYIYILFFALILIACSTKEQLSELSVVEANKVIKNKTELDDWIYKNFVKPYGIEVKFRWDKNTIKQGLYNYPPKYSNVKAVLEAVKFLWLETYVLPNTGGKDFMKEKNPIVIYMYGGPNLDSRGVKLINNYNSSGVAMSIYNVNDFDAKDFDQVYMLSRSLHHQFAKRLIGLIPYKRDEFLNISKNRYISSTEEIADSGLTQKKLLKVTSSANKSGFFTHYSRLSAEDDFAEIISGMLTNSQAVVLEALENAKTPYQDADPKVQEMYNERAKKAFYEITKKQQMVYEYFNKDIGINLKRMQIISVQRIKAFLNK